MMANHPGRSGRFLALLLALLGTVQIAGCGEPAPVGTVTFLTGLSEAETAAFRQVLDAFTEKYHIRVDLESTRALSPVLLSAVQNGTPPDIAVLPNPGELANYIDRGALHPLDGLSGPGSASGYTTQWRQLQQMGRQHLYAVAIKVELKSLVWYNPSQFNRDQPQTWDQLVTLSRSMHDTGSTPWCLGMGDAPSSGWSGTDWIEDILLHQSGVDSYRRWVAGTLKWSSPQVRQAWRTWGEIAVEPGMVHGGAPAALLTDFGDAARPMFTDPPHCYLYHGASFMLGSYLGYTDQYGDSMHLLPGVHFNFFPFPSFGSQQGAARGQVSEVAGDLAGMFNDTPQARKLIEYLATDAGQRVWPKISNGGVFSASRTVAQEEKHAVSHQIASSLTSSADVLCFDASDLMPKAMTNAFYQAVLAYLDDPARLDTLLGQLDDVRQGIPADDWLDLPCGGQ